LKKGILSFDLMPRQVAQLAKVAFVLVQHQGGRVAQHRRCAFVVALVAMPGDRINPCCQLAPAILCGVVNPASISARVASKPKPR
jgi:hypothetical protein